MSNDNEVIGDTRYHLRAHFPRDQAYVTSCLSMNDAEDLFELLNMILLTLCKCVSKVRGH